MADEAEAALPNETGGVLLGYHVSRTDEIVVTDVVGPGPNAQHETRRFEPDSAYQETEIAGRYERSSRLVVYLGDWHSHPRSGPCLSGKDRRTLRTISRFKAARLAKPLMVVVGKREGWSLAAWRFSPPRLRFFPGRAVLLAVKPFEIDDAVGQGRPTEAE